MSTTKLKAVGSKRQRVTGVAMVAQPERTGRTQLRPALARAFSRDRQDIFFAKLAETCNVRMSADHAEVSQQTIWRWRQKDAEFARRFELVRADAHADLQMRLMVIAREGVTGEQWDEVGEDGITRRCFRRDSPESMQFLVTRHEAAVAATIIDPGQSERAPRVTLDELIERMTIRLSELESASEAGEAAEHGADR